MPEPNLLLFPIMGGYYFLIRCELFRYHQQRLEAQKLIFNSVLGGIFFLFVSWVVCQLATVLFPSIVDFVKKNYPIRVAFFGTCIASFLLAILVTEVSNLFVSKSKQVRIAISQGGTEFERLCESCYRNADMIQVTLKNDKCYVGWIKAVPIPSSMSFFSGSSSYDFITILPSFSGYRSQETKELRFTTQYLDIYAEYVKEGKVTDINDLATQVIAVSEIVSANRFDMEMYERFNGQGQSD